MIVFRSEIVVRPGCWRDLLELLKEHRPAELRWRMLQCQNGPGHRWILEEEYESYTAMEQFWAGVGLSSEQRAEFYRRYEELVESTLARDTYLVVYP